MATLELSDAAAPYTFEIEYNNGLHFAASPHLTNFIDAILKFKAMTSIEAFSILPGGAADSWVYTFRAPGRTWEQHMRLAGDIFYITPLNVPNEWTDEEVAMHTDVRRKAFTLIAAFSVERIEATFTA